ncbi:hypothetical protein Q4567_08570 [Aliiglaciecola sp. 2_MG-2023]|uniref:hypothetical protein n=1 Tax=unclassified Aliiglaciecola TaxID=2593648 RepID=UPI0026E1F089|nr:MULTISPECIES: hypothetical protein [unclassified Aliiglaciecola]MDO6710768.1 hypothetical protein [Aliiglaciecola sp. 2_MG-2023]MDO6751824.1 hypothetical protein [Aliiglaciecola sp. 1_MG-2023]
MTNSKVMTLLKVVMISGLCLIMLGIYLHLFSQTIDEMGIDGIIISAACVAVGMIMSLPTKMIITFILVKRESEQTERVLDNRI